MITVTAEGIEKNYGATRALRGLNMSLHSGEIVGIAGPNGAGKSTLTRMLAGEEQPDKGRIELDRGDGAKTECWRHVAVVHQEPHVWLNMSVRENLAVGKETSWIGRIASPARSDEILQRLEIAQYADYQLADLSLAIRQRVEIARALLSDADVFLFDEPNSALTDEESRALFATMAELAADGKIVLLITHRLNDFVRCCRRVLVLRDGVIATELTGGEVTEQAIAVALSSEAVANRRTGTDRRQSDACQEPQETLQLVGWTDSNDAFRNVSITLSRGMVTVLAGVEGSGARELLQAIAGYRKVERIAANAAGVLPPVAYLAASRRDTVFSNMSVGENLLIRLGWKALSSPVPLLDRPGIQKASAHAIERYHIKAGGPDHPITSLSGGNQQKVVLGAAMAQPAEILAIEEPTRGVDIASSSEIYTLIEHYAKTGRAVVLYCTEIQEMLQVADRIVAMHAGSIVKDIRIAHVESASELSSILAAAESGT